MEPKRTKKRIVCDAVAAAAAETMSERYRRHKSLSREIGAGIKAGIAAHNKVGQELGCLPATPLEVRAAILSAITLELRLRDEADVQAFIDDLKACVLRDEAWVDVVL
jgi:3-dehydroquinate synthetase